MKASIIVGLVLFSMMMLGCASTPKTEKAVAVEDAELIQVDLVLNKNAYPAPNRLHSRLINESSGELLGSLVYWDFNHDSAYEMLEFTPIDAKTQTFFDFNGDGQIDWKTP